MRWNFLWINFPGRRGFAMEISLESRLSDPQRQYDHWGIAELTAFKLQWIGRDRKIDGARKVSSAG
jgi:hypothetical protein